jgi:hypothetical protein
MDREWVRPVAGDCPCVVFVHGIFSSAVTCWEKEGMPGWPRLLAASFPGIAICAVSYNTEVFSGHYSISDVADSLHERLRQDGVLVRGRKLIFVCHSMGGLVVRRMLVQRRNELADLEIEIGLLLVASPSLGSNYAKWLAPIARSLGHTQADALRLSEANYWLLDLDRDFQQILHDGRPRIVGRELIEDRLVVLRWLWLFPRVVPAMSGARYFADRLKIARTDHFSIAAPESADSLQHGALCSLVEDLTGERRRFVPEAPVQRVFVSYRHIDPDQGVALDLAHAFQQAGVACFIDRRLRVGMEWQKEIAHELDSCTHFVVLISADTSLSDMVRQEIAHAYRRAKRGACAILPVRVAFAGQLPSDLATILDPIQQAFWCRGDSTQALAQQLMDAVLGGSWTPLPAPAAPPPPTSAGPRAPLPQADFRALVESGTQAADAPLYVRRAADEQLDAVLAAPFTALVSGPRQSGKSSLLARAMPSLRNARHDVVYLDLQQADAAVFETLSAWSHHLARQLVRQTKAGAAPADNAFDRSPMVALTELVEDRILAGRQRPLTIILDEVDRLFGRPISLDAFSQLRGWHNNRAVNPPLWGRVSLLLAHSTHPYLWIPDSDRSPFNVGTRIRMADFTLDQVRELQRRIAGAELPEPKLQALLELTGGQPYLTRLGLYHLLTIGAELDQAAMSGEAGIFGDHLRAISYNLARRPELLASLCEILAAGRCDDERNFQRLVAAGLVRGPDREHTEIHRGLYRSYFRTLQ